MNDNIQIGTERDEQRISHELAVKAAKQKVGECPDCDGEGMCATECDSHPRCDKCTYNSLVSDNEPICPTCAPLRKLAKSCWHEPDKGYHDDIVSITKCKHCGESKKRDKNWEACQPNPTYHIREIVAMLKTLGEWEEFKLWGGMLLELYDTLTSDVLLLEAATLYLMEVTDG
jgi:hypothetical protein